MNNRGFQENHVQIQVLGPIREKIPLVLFSFYEVGLHQISSTDQPLHSLTIFQKKHTLFLKLLQEQLFQNSVQNMILKRLIRLLKSQTKKSKTDNFGAALRLVWLTCFQVRVSVGVKWSRCWSKYSSSTASSFRWRCTLAGTPKLPL